MAAGAKFWFSCLLFLSSAALAQQPSTIQVGVVPAEKITLADTNRFVGRIEAIERVDIRARVTGFLEKVDFKDGDRVKEGAPLYQIERGPFEAAVQQARAAVEKAQAHPGKCQRPEAARRRTDKDQRDFPGHAGRPQCRGAGGRRQPRGGRCRSENGRDQPRLHRNLIADRWPHRPNGGDAGQRRKSQFGRADHDRQR